jgi:hypothetical protein
MKKQQKGGKKENWQSVLAGLSLVFIFQIFFRQMVPPDFIRIGRQSSGRFPKESCCLSMFWR